MKKKFNTLLLALLICLLSACGESFLELKPYIQTPIDETILTEYDVLNALRGTYAGLRNTNLYGRSIPIIGDLAADNIFISSKNTGRYVYLDQYVILKSNGYYLDLWSNAYTVILRTNNIINATLPESDNLNQLKGEAYALRALMYFELLRNFSRPYSDNPNGPGVPIVLKFDPDFKPGRSTIQEVYDQIFSDLDTSYKLQTVNNGSNRFSKYATRALAAKVSLYTEKYTQALDYANDVIINSGLALLARADLLSYWAAPAPSAGSKVETLFEVSADGTANAGNEELGYIFIQSGYGDLLANDALYVLYKNTDIRKSLIVVGKRVDAENPAYLVNKFKNITGDRDDKKVLRLSEVYLIAAEAANRLNDDGQSREKLNALVSRRDPSLIYNSSGDQLLEDIVLERRKEMAFEGDRFYDLNRLKRDIVRVGGSYSNRNIPYSSYLRVAPIPQSERDVNSNIEQNPGYE